MRTDRSKQNELESQETYTYSVGVPNPSQHGTEAAAALAHETFEYNKVRLELTFFRIVNLSLKFKREQLLHVVTIYY